MGNSDPFLICVLVFLCIACFVFAMLRVAEMIWGNESINNRATKKWLSINQTATQPINQDHKTPVHSLT